MSIAKNAFGLLARLQRSNIPSGTPFRTVLGCTRPCSSTIKKDVTTTAGAPSTEEKNEVSQSDSRINVKGHRPSELDKVILVKTGRYKTKEDIPDFVSDEIINRAKSKTRIYLNICMAGVLLVAIVFMVRKGRQDMDDGESVALMNMRRHPQIYQAAIDEEAKRNK